MASLFKRVDTAARGVSHDDWTDVSAEVIAYLHEALATQIKTSDEITAELFICQCHGKRNKTPSSGLAAGHRVAISINGALWDSQGATTREGVEIQAKKAMLRNSGGGMGFDVDTRWAETGADILALPVAGGPVAQAVEVLVAEALAEHRAQQLAQCSPASPSTNKLRL